MLDKFYFSKNAKTNSGHETSLYVNSVNVYFLFISFALNVSHHNCSCRVRYRRKMKNKKTNKANRQDFIMGLQYANKPVWYALCTGRGRKPRKNQDKKVDYDEWKKIDPDNTILQRSLFWDDYELNQIGVLSKVEVLGANTSAT